MFWHQVSAWFAGLSADAVQLAAGLLLQSTVLLGLGLIAGRLVRSKGAALESAVYRTTLAAVTLCPLVSLLLAAAGVQVLAVPIPEVASQPQYGDQPHTESADETALPDSDAIAPADAFAPIDDATWQDEFAMDDWAADPDAAILDDTETSLAGVETAEEAAANRQGLAGDSTPELGADATASTPANPHPRRLLVCVLTAVWLIGSCWLLLRLLAAHLRMMRLARTACDAGPAVAAQCRALADRMGVRAPAVRRNPFLTSPCLVGLWRPAILLPGADSSDGQSEREVLVHELAHLVRRDHVWHLLGRLSGAVLFFQPLLWLLMRRMVRTAEEVCDDHVVELGSDRRQYARRLADIAERYHPQSPAAAVGMISVKSLLGRRVVRILDGSRRLSLRTGAWSAATTVAMGSIAALLVALVAVGSAPADARPHGEAAVEAETAASPEDDEKAAVANPAAEPAQASAEEPPPERAGDLAAPVLITAAGKPIHVGGFAAPSMGDFDGDGTSDLLVGQRVMGRLRIYRNVGTNARPRFDTFEWFKAGGHVAGVPVCCQTAFTPQLADFDGDGRTDILTGAGYGEAYVFRRKPDGTFAEAEILANRKGEDQMSRRFPSGRTIPYNTMVFLHDWDGDGDGDLLFGKSYSCLVPNEGTRGQPVFGEAVPIAVDGEPIPMGIVGPCVADWDGDGRDDLLIGRKSDIVWYRNTGTRGKPVLQPPQILISRSGWSTERDDIARKPARPQAICAVDFNGDGRLDLLLGDFYFTKLDLPEPSEPQKAQMETAFRRRSEAFGRYYELLHDAEGQTRQERVGRIREALRNWQEAVTLEAAVNPSLYQRYHGRVWLYERITPQKPRKITSAVRARAGKEQPTPTHTDPAIEAFLERVEQVPGRKPGDPPRRRTLHSRNPDGQITTLRLKDCKLTTDDFEQIGRMRHLESLLLSGSNVTDDDLRHLKGLTNLRELNLWDSEIDGSGLAHLRDLDRLETLNLGDAKITDDALPHLEQLDGLRYLALNRNKITDAGLAHLGRLRQLEALKLGETEVTDAGLRHLQPLKKLRSITLDETAVTDWGLAYLSEFPNLSWISSPIATAEEVVHRLEAGDYQAAHEMVTVGLDFVKRGQLRLLKLQSVPRTERDKSLNRYRFHLEMDWKVEAERIDDVFYADFAVNRGAIQVHQVGIHDD